MQYSIQHPGGAIWEFHVIGSERAPQIILRHIRTPRKRAVAVDPPTTCQPQLPAANTESRGSFAEASTGSSVSAAFAAYIDGTLVVGALVPESFDHYGSVYRAAKPMISQSGRDNSLKLDACSRRPPTSIIFWPPATAVTDD